MGKEVEYTDDGLTTVQQPKVCQHTGICVEILSSAYRPEERPQVQIGSATAGELIIRISRCPSGALGYRLNKRNK